MKKNRTEIMCSLHNKYPTKIQWEYVVMELEEILKKDAYFVDYNNWGLDFDIDWIVYKWYWFVISEITSENKYSLEYYDCTAIVAIWKDKETWKNISFLSHQAPDSVMWTMFQESLKDMLEELLRRSEKWSIDVVILWGDSKQKYTVYRQVIDKLWQLIEDVIEKDPYVLWWPTNKNYEWHRLWKDIFVDTKNRVVHYYKSHYDLSSNKDFPSIEVFDKF